MKLDCKAKNYGNVVYIKLKFWGDYIFAKFLCRKWKTSATYISLFGWVKKIASSFIIRICNGRTLCSTTWCPSLLFTKRAKVFLKLWLCIFSSFPIAIIFILIMYQTLNQGIKNILGDVKGGFLSETVRIVFQISKSLK